MSSKYLVLPLLALLAACSSTPPRTARNMPLCEAGSFPATRTDGMRAGRACGKAVNQQIAYSPEPLQTVPRARKQFSAHDTDVPETFVGLSISGGGSRAAVYGMAVMRELDRLGILQHVSAISTTSGGSLPGAYYALNGKAMDWQKAQEAMSVDYMSKWLRKNLQPVQLWNLVSTDEDRSDLMADVFDQVLFKGATYGDLGKFAAGSAPIWFANATELGVAERFTFDNERFMALNSDLSKFPISQAVVASSAFPGVFNSVTLRSYGQHVNGGKPDVRYTHLIDGGPTDNLGIEALLELARSYQARQPSRRPDGTVGRQGNCLLMIVDAHPRGTPYRYSKRTDLRGFTGRLVDMNFFDSIDAMLITRRADLLGYLGLQDGEIGGRKSPQFVFFDTPLEPSRLGQSRRVGTGHADPQAYDGMTPNEVASTVDIPERHFRCAAWHLNLSGLEAIQAYEAGEGDSAPRPAERSLAMEIQAGLHNRLVSQINTNFRLVGPKHCPAKFLEAALIDAATTVVRDDYASQSAACRWLRDRQLPVGDACGKLLPQASLERFPLASKIAMSKLDEDGNPIDDTVQCNRNIE